jgi:hypothetical protein
MTSAVGLIAATSPSSALVVVVLNHFGAFHAQCSESCPLLEVTDPVLELPAGHLLSSFHDKLTEQVFNALHELNIEANSCSTVETFFL